MKLEGKVALVTGASSGIGRAIALLFAKEGAKVVALARRLERLEELAKEAEGASGELKPFVADLSKEADIQAACKFTTDSFGKVDILVNNAGIMDEMTPLAEVTDELWDSIINVNLTAPMKLTRAVIGGMLERGSGSIVNVASVGGLHGCRGGTSYVTSKHGFVGMTKSVAFMYAMKGIRCNVICPGGVETEIMGAGMSKASPFGLERSMSGIMNNPRMGTSEEIANVAIFLASDDSSFINGAAIVADAGWTAY
jgi:NAD(P)-dependent dehydrogenase (short-subunit alcohol dehydrogenase family)